MLNLDYKLKSTWPKLAWVCVLYKEPKGATIFHGPMVETDEEWIVEGVWDGEFSKGNFDLTEIFFGSGLRLRGNRIVFVSSGSTFDRLLYHQSSKEFYISNTLAGLLHLSNMTLKDDYKDYSSDAYSIIHGLQNRKSNIPTNQSEITSLYYNNIEFDLDCWSHQEISKPDTAPDFRDYKGYSQFLFETAEALGKNASSEIRKFKVTPLSTISKGYDSCAVSVVSKYSGCQDTVTISEASRAWKTSDSGKEIANILHMTCKEYPSRVNFYPDEVALWAGEGRAGVLNWTLFGFKQPLTMLFSGCHGEKVWDRLDHDHPDPFVRRDTSAHGFCEFRLIYGVFHVPVPFWGVRKLEQIRSITQQKDMKKFYINKDYDKPIARRIVEEAGVPRHLFGMKNQNTSLESPFRWPYSKSAQKSFQIYLSKIGIKPLSFFKVKLYRVLFYAYHLLYINLGKKIKLTPPKPIVFSKIPACYYLFQWANHALMDIYRKDK